VQQAASTACAALAAAVQADEVRLEAKAIEAVARVAKNFDLELDAVKLRTRAEARLGEMLQQGEAAGLINRHGGARRVQVSDSETCSPATLKDIGVDAKLSTRSRKLADLGQQAAKSGRPACRAGGPDREVRKFAPLFSPLGGQAADISLQICRLMSANH